MGVVIKGKPARILICLIFVTLAAFVLPAMGVEKAPAAAGDILLASSDYPGIEGNGASIDVSLSADGKYAVLSSTATNLIPGGTTNIQVFRKNLQTGEMKLCSADISAAEGNNNSSSPVISADGRYVAFMSGATNLIPGGTTSTQVFRKDLQTAEVKLCSANASGVQGNNTCSTPSLSSDGRYVAFLSSSTNLVLGGTTGSQIFRKDLQTGDVKLCSANAAGVQGDQASSYTSLSSDGRYVAFLSQSTNLVPGGTALQQIFRKDLNTGEVLVCSSSAAGVAGNNGSSYPCITYDGRFVAFLSAATNLTAPPTTNTQIFRKDLLTGEVKVCSMDAAGVLGNNASVWPCMSYEGRYVTFSSTATNLVMPATTNLQVFRKDIQTGEVKLCSSNSAGAQGNNISLESAMSFDGRYVAFYSQATNLVAGGTTGQQVFRKELSAPYTFYFAEGYTGNNFQEYLCLGNPNAAPISATVTFLFNGAAPQDQVVTIPAGSRFTLDVNTAVGPNRDVSARIVSDSPFVAERPMYFNYQGRWTGGHDAVGTNITSTNWYFAEGYTAPGFEEWICVLNPGDTPANLTFRFQTQEEGEKVVPGGILLPHSRGSFPANVLLAGNSYQTSLKLESDTSIVAERPMYFSYSGTNNWQWQGGSCVMGRPFLASQYYLAEGTTRSGFEEWLTLQNPSPNPIIVQATYQLGPGQGPPVNKTYTIDANRRWTGYVPTEIGTEKDASVYLVSSSPFLAERPMYFNYQGTASRNWEGGHCVIGAPSTAADWFLAEGFTGGDFEEWLCVQNPGATEAQVQITYYTQEAGALPPRTETIPAHTRQTFLVNTHAGPNYQLSARIRVTSGPEVVVERPMYFSFRSWDGGSDVVGYTP